MGRQKNHQPAEQADEVIVVQIGGLVYEFDVSESEKKQGDANAVIKTERDTKGEGAKQNKVRIHERAGPGANPFEAGVSKVKDRFEIELADPAFGHKTHNGYRH